MNADLELIHPDAVRTTLERVAENVSVTDRHRWSFPISNGTAHIVMAELDDCWLVLRCAVAAGEPTSDRTWQWLKWNRELTGGAKFALDSSLRPHLRIELPLDANADFAARLSTALIGMRAGLALCGGESSLAGVEPGTPTGYSELEGRVPPRPLPTAMSLAGVEPGPPRLGDPATAGSGALETLKRICGEKNWVLSERSAGEVAVQLEVPESFYQAFVAADSGSAIRAAVDLATFDSLPEASRQAVGVLLLTVGGVVTMARATVEETEGETTVRLEVVFTDIPTAGEWSHALSALSVGCRLCAEEVRVLEDETIAREYLAVRGCASEAKPGKPEERRNNQ